MTQEQKSTQKTKSPNRRRLVIAIVGGLAAFCMLCSVCVIAFNFIPSSTDEGEEVVATIDPTTEVVEVVPPEVTAVIPSDIPELTNTPEPTNTPEQTTTPLPTAIETAIPSKTPVNVEDLQKAYFDEILPGVLIMGLTMGNLEDLFNNPQIDDLNWFAEITEELNTMLETSMELDEILVPQGCDICSEVHNELSTVETYTVKASENWIDWLVDMEYLSYLEAMADNILEIGNAFSNAQEIVEK